MTDVDGSENSTISDVILLPTKWKKDVAMAWRMDVEGDADDGDVSDCDSIIESESEEKVRLRVKVKVKILMVKVNWRLEVMLKMTMAMKTPMIVV